MIQEVEKLPIGKVILILIGTVAAGIAIWHLSYVFGIAFWSFFCGS